MNASPSIGKGAERRFAYHRFEDPSTGAAITRLTPPDVTCHRNYFYQKCFSNDGTKLLFGAEFGPAASPNWNYHWLDLPSGKVVQLTEGEDENTFGGFLSPDDQYLYFVRAGRQLIRVHLQSLEETEVYRVPNEWVGYGTWVANSACTKIVGIEIVRSDWFALSDWQKFHEMFHNKPQCQLFTLDLETGRKTVILQQRGWMGHPQYRPGDDHTVAYCHEGPHDLVDARMWFIDEDGRNRRCAKVHAAGESCTHEFWVPDGSRMIYVSYINGQSDRWICGIDPITLQDQRLMQMPPCSHLMSNTDGSLLVGDGCASPADVSDTAGHEIANDPMLHVFDLNRQTRHAVARHDSSWRVYKGNRQVTHPHPSFTPDESQVLFSSDVHGEPAIYLADVRGRG